MKRVSEAYKNPVLIVAFGERTTALKSVILSLLLIRYIIKTERHFSVDSALSERSQYVDNTLVMIVIYVRDIRRDTLYIHSHTINQHTHTQMSVY